MKSYKELAKHIKKNTNLIWNDPDPIEGNNYLITNIWWDPELEDDCELISITYNDGNSEALVYLHEILIQKEINNDKGLRYNNDKPRWSLVDFDALEDMVKVLDFGAQKYSDHNWKKGLKTTEIFESLMRHLTAYIKGEDLDTESGLSHTGHILCNAMFLSYMQKYKQDFDNRFNDLNKTHAI